MLRSVLIASLLCGLASADNPSYRCESEVFMEGQKEPVHASLTLFNERLVYDFQLGSPEEITIYDFTRGQINLLHPQRKQRLLLTTDDLLRVSAAYKARKSESELFAFCTQPKFTESFMNNQLTLTGGCLTYKTSCTQPQQPGAELIYREFADWSARLNAIRPGNLPPFARLELNQALATHELLPGKTERTTQVMWGGAKRTETIRSEHLFSWSLTAEDQRRIERARTSFAEFAPTSAEDYFQWQAEKLTKSR